MIHKVVCIFILFVGILTVAYFAWPTADKEITLITNNLEFEYGQPITVNKEDLFIEDVQFSTIENTYFIEDDQDFAEVGIYSVPISFTHNGKEFEHVVSVSVTDNTEPTIEFLRVKLVTSQNKHLSNYEQFVVVDDLSDYEIIFDDSNIDYSKVGEYTLVVEAKDNYNNTTSESINVEVVAEGQMTASFINELNSSAYVIPYYKEGILIVNKKFRIPSDFAEAEDPTAQQSVKTLINDMQNSGYDISNNYSGFRTYDNQVRAYNSIVNAYGKAHAEKVSAHPGHSEHQSGFTFDLKHRDGTLVIKESEVNWIANNAHKYGFIVRYPEGKESITGYSYEPWHLRYVGALAEDIYASKLSLEEYLTVEGGDYY